MVTYHLEMSETNMNITPCFKLIIYINGKNHEYFVPKQFLLENYLKFADALTQMKVSFPVYPL